MHYSVKQFNPFTNYTILYTMWKKSGLLLIYYMPEHIDCDGLYFLVAGV